MNMVLSQVSSFGTVVPSANNYTREVPLGPYSMLAGVYDPLQTTAMDKSDIKDLKQWHLEAARRAKRAGFGPIPLLHRL